MKFKRHRYFLGTRSLEEISDKKITNCSSYLTALQDINNLQTSQRIFKITINIYILWSGFKIIRLFVKVDRNVYKTADTSVSIHFIQNLPSKKSAKAISMIFHTRYYKIETTMKRNCTSKTLCFLQITIEHEDYPVFTVFLTIKTSSQNITITLLQTSLKLP